jgi:hypothetical protein
MYIKSIVSLISVTNKILFSLLKNGEKNVYKITIFLLKKGNHNLS